MSDKEPRRRKKRKDSQKKDDIRTDDQIFMSSKPETKDSDPEIEEEIIVPTYQPSVFAKFVFVILFSGLVLSMSFIFISLRGADRGSIDIFEDHHEEHQMEEHEVSHDEGEAWSLSEGIQDILPGIGSILSFNDEHIEDSQSPVVEAEADITKDVEDHQTSEFPVKNTDESETSTVEISTGEDIGHSVDDVSPEVYIETSSQDLDSSQIQSVEDDDDDDDEEDTENQVPKSTFEEESELESYSEEHDFHQNSQNDVDQSDFTTTSPFIQTTEASSVSDSVSHSEDFTSPLSNFETEPEEDLANDDNPIEDNAFTGPVTEVTEEEAFPFYEKADITNEEDYRIRDELDKLDEALEKSPESALRKTEELLRSHKQSPRLHYIKAQALDKLAEQQRSNKYLEDAIATYHAVMFLEGVPEALYLSAGKRAADRMRFRGFVGKSLKLLVEMMAKFPQNTELKNLVAVGYLLIGQNKEAKRVLYEVLKLAPDSGFAKVHLGFILKTDDSNYEEAIKFMSEGIASRESGVIDGRFYFHLGDALHRVGKKDEAMKVYEAAVKEGLFLSAYQRSLYNVNGLTGKPWWNALSTKYAPDFKLLEKNWLTIRDEALAITNEKNSGFLPEAEGLQEKGDWKQLELFARGRKIEKNCLKVPKTCALISQLPDAAGCKRGQVKFSIMRPSTHVWAHTGPTNCRLRSHLGLVIPEGVSIRVANETRVWEEGKVLLFDDSFEHEVWHNGNASRLVLIVDFWHPELTAHQKRTLTPI